MSSSYIYQEDLLNHMSSSMISWKTC